jgi:hypothetical protein
MAEVITERWCDGGCYSIDFTVGQSFGEPQADNSVQDEPILQELVNLTDSTHNCT